MIIKEQCKNIWKQVFNDESDYIEWYFKNIHDDNQVRLSKKDKKIVGMVYENKYKLDKKEKYSKYLVAAGVLPTYRGEGILKEMIIEGFNEAKIQGLEFLYLSPVDKEIYTRYGYEFISDLLEYTMPISKLNEFKKLENTIVLERDQDITDKVLKKLELFFAKILNSYNLKLYRDTHYIKKILSEIFCEEGVVFLSLDKSENITGYMPILKDKESILVKEFLFRDKKSLSTLLSVAFGYKNYYKNIRIITGVKDNLEDYFKSNNEIEKKVKNKIQLRIISVEKSLERLKKVIEKESIIINVIDNILMENTGKYKIDKENIIKTDEKEDIKIKIGELGQLIYGYRTMEQLEKLGVIEILKNKKLEIKEVNYFNQDF